MAGVKARRGRGRHAEIRLGAEGQACVPTRLLCQVMPGALHCGVGAEEAGRRAQGTSIRPEACFVSTELAHQRCLESQDPRPKNMELTLQSLQPPASPRQRLCWKTSRYVRMLMGVSRVVQTACDPPQTHPQVTSLCPLNLRDAGSLFTSQPALGSQKFLPSCVEQPWNSRSTMGTLSDAKLCWSSSTSVLTWQEKKHGWGKGCMFGPRPTCLRAPGFESQLLTPASC